MRGLPIGLPVLRGIHWGMHRLFERAGYRWELRRSGELKLGLWRKAWRKPKKGVAPKRLVLLPGFGDTPLSWLPVLAILLPVVRKKYDEIILVDFPGFVGFLSKERSFHSMDLMMRAVYDTLDSLRPDTILGHSLGAWLAAHYAASCGAGERVNPAPKTEYPGPRLIALVNPAGVFGSVDIRLEWEGKFRRVVENGFHELRPYLFAKEPVWFRLLSEEFSQFLYRDDILQFMRSVRDDHLVEPRLDKLKSRVWLIWGEKDSLLPPCAQQWKDGLTGSPEPPKIILLKGLGHSPQVENAAAIAAVLGQLFLDRIPHGMGRRWWEVVSV